MRVLIVGGTGFVGPPVVRKLSRLGHAVTVFHRGDHEPELPFGVEHVHAVEAAAPVVAYPASLTEMAWDVVLAMFPIGERDAAALMRTFRGVARRVVALSSGDVYRAYGVLMGTEPGPPDPTPIPEDAPLRQSPYPYRGHADLPPELHDYEKIFVERAVLADRDLPGTVLRLPVVWGPGDPHGRFTSVWRRIADGGEAIVMGRSYGGWRWTHGYVDDVAEAVVLAVLRDRAKGKIYNVGEAKPPTMAERAASFARALGRRVRIVLMDDDDDRLPRHLAPDPGRNFGQDLVYDTSRIRADLDWRETAPLDEELRETAAWEESRRDVAPQPTPGEYAAEDEAARLFSTEPRSPAASPRGSAREDS